MASPASCPEEGLTVDWKIKNFIYSLEPIRSPEFHLNKYPSRIEFSLNGRSIGFSFVFGTSCELQRRRGNEWKTEISGGKFSLLTCDGSPELPISRNLRNVIFGGRRNAFLPEGTLTVRYRDPKASEPGSLLRFIDSGKLFIDSQIGVNRKHFLWTFKDFCESQGKCEKYVEASELYGNVILRLTDMSGNNPIEQFSIEIARSGGERCYCVLKISVVEVDGKAVNEVKDEFIFEKENGWQTRGFPMIIQMSKLLACKDLLLPDGTLTLKCYFAISSGKVTTGSCVMNYCENATALLKETEDLSMTFNGEKDSGCVTKLQTHLKSILEDGPLHDVSIQVGSESIPAHKSILSARSPVFRAMFTKDMKEAIDNTVVIENFDVETVRRLLLYMYTGTMHDGQWESMKRLYLASDMYGVMSLKEKCVSFLKTNLSVSNVCEALAIVDLHEDADLKKAAFDIISENDSEVFASEEWKEFERTRSSTAFQVLREICCNKRPRLN